jgi:hypothetical protein
MQFTICPNLQQFFLSIRPALGPTHPPIQRRQGALSSGKQLRHLADHSPPSNAEVKNEQSYTSNASYTFMLCIGVTSSLL